MPKAYVPACKTTPEVVQEAAESVAKLIQRAVWEERCRCIDIIDNNLGDYGSVHISDDDLERIIDEIKGPDGIRGN